MFSNFPLKFRLAIQSVQRIFYEPDFVFFKAQTGNETILNLSDICVTIMVRTGPIRFLKN